MLRHVQGIRKIKKYLYVDGFGRRGMSIIISFLYLFLRTFVNIKALSADLAGNYTSNGFLRVSCNGGLNQMRAAVCTSYSSTSLFLLYDKLKCLITRFGISDL